MKKGRTEIITRGCLSDDVSVPEERSKHVRARITNMENAILGMSSLVSELDNKIMGTRCILNKRSVTKYKLFYERECSHKKYDSRNTNKFYDPSYLENISRNLYKNKNKNNTFSKTYIKNTYSLKRNMSEGFVGVLSEIRKVGDKCDRIEQQQRS